jgi:hypothetical protein
MFAELPNWISMPPIPYTEIDDQLKDKHLQWLHEKGCLVYYRDHRDREIDNYTMRFKAEYKYNGWFYIYSNRKDENLLQRKSRITENKKTKFPMLWATDEITQSKHGESLQAALDQEGRNQRYERVFLYHSN